MTGDLSTGGRERKANRLLNEKSPYLRHHAYNPVDWYPWGEEAFRRAQEVDKPIFLSIGYSSCHWCHVMEEESFQDDEVAALINENFVPIKVDREERPDLDATYLAAAQALSGGGGWPLTLILTPDKKPFFAATYLPKESRGDMIGLVNFLPTVIDFWKDRRGEIEATSQKVMDLLKAEGGSTAGGGLGEETLMDAFQRLMESFDERYGGFGTAPKFPTPHRLTFLLRYWNRTGDDKALWMADRTLEEMRRGGIFDQLGKGFHRYSTDQVWLVPHFEKMLYDQALLAMAYIEGWQATGKEEHARTAREVLDYVLVSMTSPDGGFFSSEDADSEGEEGRFYFWTEEEAKQVLDPDELKVAQQVFGLSSPGNVREGVHGHLLGKNVLHLVPSPNDGPDPRAEAVRKKLLARRAQRVPPAKDDKVMADWNGLMIAALAQGASAFLDDRYNKAARRAAGMVLEKMRTGDGSLLHVYKDGSAEVPGFLDDHAFLAWGLLELYQSDQDVRWLEAARELVRVMDQRFWDKEGGFFQTAEGAPDVVHRRKEFYDGAVPSGNSIALLDLLLLYRITEVPDLMGKAEATITAFSGAIFRAPENHAQFLNAVDFKLGPSYSIVVAGPREAEDTREFLKELGPRYLPNKVVLILEPGAQGDRLRSISPLVQGQAMKEGKAVAHICSDRTCLPETTEAKEFARLLRPA